MDTKTYISQAQTYKRSVASRYLPAGSEEIVSKIREADQQLLSVKDDGHFYLLCCEKGAVTLVSPGGKVIDDLPLLAEAKELLSKAKVKDGLVQQLNQRDERCLP